jgi:transcriptional regulator with XRE-family HTH domain
MTIHEKIKRLRLRNGMSQAGLAELVGASQRAVSDWEKHTTPRAAHLVKLAELFGVSVDVLTDDAAGLPDGCAMKSLKDEGLAALSLAADVAKLKAMAAELELIAARLEGLK